MTEVDDTLASAKQALANNQPERAGDLLITLLNKPDDKPLSEIRAMLQRTAAENHRASQFHLALMQLQGHGGANDESAAVELLTEVVQSSETSDLTGQAYQVLGECYVRGNGVAADETLAFRHYLEAAERGTVQAAFNVGLSYDEGILGRNPDVALALQYYARAAKVGHVQAMSNIVLLYMSGKAPLPVDDAVRDLLEDGVQTEDVASAEMIRASQNALVEWLKQMGA